jgi:hypothetical protein
MSTGWGGRVLVRVQDGALRLMYRHSPGSTVHCFKGSCVLPAPMEVSAWWWASVAVTARATCAAPPA